MSTPQQPEALRDARWYMVNRDGMATLCTDKADAEKEAADAQSVWPHMGPHRAVQLVEAADVEAMRAGYAAARLEIASLQARIKTMAEDHADELTMAHLDGRMRTAQPAGAQQPDTAYAALPDDDRDYMRKVVAVAVTMLFDGHKEDVMRVFSTGELSEFVTITAAMRGEQVEDIYRRAWDLLSLPARASHGQAPAQAAPAAVAGPLNELGDIAMFTTPAQRGELAGDGKPCNNDHDPDCRWPDCLCRTREAAARAAQEGKP